MTATSTATCPVCREQFDAPLAFALHVAACTTPHDSVSLTPTTAAATPTAVSSAAAAVATPTASCPMCHMVYTSAMAAHEIDFHEEECERVNEYMGPIVPMRLDANNGISSGTVRPSSGAKRSRDHTDVSSTVAIAAAGPIVKLFPTHCAMCDAGGRTLLHCAGTCARSFHPLCIEEINTARDFAANGTATVVGASSSSSLSAASNQASTASTMAAGGNVSFATAIMRDKKAQKAWVCGECTRGVHTCTLCGFLGHDGHEIVRCSLADCGFFFHPACLREHNERALSPLVCPRHTCTACHAIETDMASCSSCTKCCTSIHLRCRGVTGEAATPTTATHTRGRGDVLDPNFHVCDAHKNTADGASPTSAVLTPERRAAQYAGLKMHTRPGDIVLILEYGNLLLPSSAKDVAPEAYNQWGIVQRVESLGDSVLPAWWTQLLTVSLFSDDSSISIANRYVLPVGSMRQYASPALMVRDAIKWHSMGELHARQLEKQRSGATDTAAVAVATASPTALLTRIMLAFKERAKSLGMSSAECLENTNDGFAAWQRFYDASPRTYAGTSAPVYVALDTRGRHMPDMEIATASDHTKRLSHRPHESTGESDDDVDMEDASSPSASGQDNALSTSVLGTPKNQSATDGVHVDVVEVMARLLEGVEAQLSRGSFLGGAADSLKDLVASIGDDDNDGSDVEMTEIIELPPLQDDEGSNDEQDNEHRLSMDDLLNPLSKKNRASSALVALQSSSLPSNSTNKNEAAHAISQPEASVSVQFRKRPLKSMADDAVTVSEVFDTTTATSKRPKLGHDKKSPIAVDFAHLPLHLKKPRGSVFGRKPLPVRPALLPKEKLATEYPRAELHNLQRKVNAFFETEDDYDGRLLMEYALYRPAFYRPTPFLYRSARVGRRVDAITRMLLCQDKRNLKCYVRVDQSASTSASTRTCPFKSVHGTRLSYVSVDLIGISTFSALENEVRCRVATAVVKKERSTGWHWQSSVGSSVTVEEEVRKPEIRLMYCAYDGSEHALPTHKLHRQQQPEWLCFCANVAHLTATVIQH